MTLRYGPNKGPIMVTDLVRGFDSWLLVTNIIWTLNLNFGAWLLVTDIWTLNFGAWLLVIDIWTLNFGAWLLVRGFG